MKFLHSTLPILLFAVAAMHSCSSGDPSSAKNDTANSSSEILEQPPAIPVIIVPDPSFVVAPEITSQFGPNCIMRDVIIDQNNNIWMASWQGIIMYDGKTFTNFTLKNGLHHHRIFSLLEDSKGILWFGTLGAGVYNYDGATFKNINENNGLINNRVFSIFEDDAGNMWFGTDSGVSCYDGQKFLNFGVNDSLKGEVNTIAQDKNGVIWIGTNDGLFTYADKKVSSVLTEYKTFYSNVRCIERDSKGVMWIGAARGLYKCIPEKGASPELVSVNSNFTGNVREDHEGNLLLTEDGLYRFNGTKRETIVAHVSNLGIFGATEDKNGNVWYGAMDGLHKWDGKTVTSYSSH